MTNTEPIYYIPGRPSSSAALGQALHSMLPPGRSPLAALCIGSTLVSGDRLGPRVGSILKPHASGQFLVFGTEEAPVHALNLNQTVEHIRCSQPNAVILAVDAALSERRYLGQITIGRGPVLPGSGIHKELSKTGDIHITGIVSISGYMEYFILKHTPRSQVERLASVIAEGILFCISQDMEQERTGAAIPLRSD